MLQRAGARLPLVLLCAGLAAGAPAQDSAETAPIEEVVVTGEFPGPGMWRVARPGAPGRVLWIVGDPPPLPKRIKWKSRDVEMVAVRAQEILLDVSVRLLPDEKIGVFRGLSLLPSALRARRNPDGGTLRQHVPPDLYARWLEQKKRYLGRDRGVEQWRPIFAADKLRRAAYDELNLREGGMVWEVVGRLAKKYEITTTTPTLEFRFPARDLKGKIREFSRARLADTECFATTLDLTEALSDRETEARRAQAWATADLATLASLPALPNPFVPCAAAVLDTGLAKELIPADIRERMYDLWIEAAVKSLAANETTLAIVPLSKLTREEGYLERLRARGYEIEAPR